MHSDALQMLRPYLHWVWVQAERPFQVPQDVLDLPGVSYREPDPGHPIWRCEIPHTTWMLKPVRAFFDAVAASQPKPHETSYDAPHLLRELYPHQRVAVSTALEHDSLLLGDQMGLGKTTSAIAYAATLRKHYDGAPALIVAPKVVRGVWRREIAACVGRGQGDLFCGIESTDPNDFDVRFWLERAGWIFVHYDVVHAWWSQILTRKPCVVIADEVHLAKNSRTRRGKALELASSLSKHRMLLTGTPIPNKVGEMWNLLQLVTGKWTWGSPRLFRTRYAGAYFDGHGLRDGKPSNTDELRERMTGCYLRRTVSDAGLELPPLTRQVVEAELSPTALRRYTKLLGEHDPVAVMRALVHGTAGQATLEWLGKLRKIVSKAKLPITIAQARLALDEGEQVVIFTWQRETAEAIAEKLDGAVIHGGVPQEEREGRIAAFQAGACRAVVATLAAMSVGVTLHAGRILIMHDLDWVPANMLQAEARLYRIGQTRPVLSKWVVSPRTLDELFVRAVRAKAVNMQSADDFSADSLAEVLGVEEAEHGVESLLAWAREG